MKTGIYFLVFVTCSFYACKLSKSYDISKLNAEIECSCNAVVKSIKFFKKSYRSEKSIEVFGGILMPIDRIDEEEYVYTEFKVVKDCLDMEFKKSDDEIYFVITEKQWQQIRDYSCD